MPIFASRAAGAIRAFGMTVSSGASAIARDIYFRFNSLLLKGNTGEPLDTTPMLPPPVTYDNSGNAVVVSPVNTITSSLRSPNNGQYYSNYFNGSTDYLTVPQTFSLPTTTTAFTVEAWVYINAYTGLAISSTNWASGGAIPFFFGLVNTSASGSDVGGKPSLNYYDGSSWATGVISSVTIPLGTWAHVAGVFDGATAKIYVNGTQTGTWTTTWTTSSQVNYHIGRRWDTGGNNYFSGYISNYRLVIGTAVYTSNFTPSTTPLTAITNTKCLTSQSNRFIDNSSNNYAITPNGTVSVSQFNPFGTPSAYDSYGSVNFNGSSYLSTPYNSQFDFGTGDFTVEWWWYLNATFSGMEGPGIGQKASDGGNGWIIYRNHSINTDKITIRLSSANNDYSATVVPTVGQWQHWAVSRSGTTLQWYCNGVACGTYTGATGNASAGSSAPMYIGYAQTWSYTTGSSYLSNIRVTKGTALYTGTSAFTPPTTQLTSAAGTTLLTAQYNGSPTNSMIVDKSNVNSVITRTGNVSQGTFSPYHNSWSTYFNGSSYINAATNTATAFGTGDFTIELWVYPTAYPATAGTIYDTRPAGTGSASGRNLINLSSTGVPSYVSTVTTSGGTCPLATWTHIAVARQGTSTKMFVDGVQVGTTLADSTSYAVGANRPIIGTDGNSPLSAGYSFIGYISNLRVIKGKALYTAPFTPSVKPLSILNDSSSTTAFLALTNGRVDDISVFRHALTMTGTISTSMLSPFSPSIIAQNQGYYSTYFPSASWLLTPAISQTNIGTQDFTVELWFYMTNTASYGTLFNLGRYDTGIMLRIDTQAYVIYVMNSEITATGTAPLNTWVHLALVRKAGSMYVWANGSQVGTTKANSATISPTAAIKIGSSAHTSNEHFFGYISNIRLVVGNGLYSSAFTPPTTPLTAIAGTQFLGLQNTTQEDTSPNKMQVYVNGGTPTVVPFSPFTASATTVTVGTLMSPYQISGSMYFDGAGDYLTIPDAPIYNLTSGAWTIDCYIFSTGATGTFRTIISKRNGGSQWQIYIQTGTNLFGFYNGTQYVTNIAILPNIWYHVAASYDGTNLRMFVNGVLGYTGAVTAAAGTDSIYIGSVAGSSEFFSGYIAGLRVIRGKALYAAAFIPPTSFPTSSPETILLIKGDNAGIYDSTGGNNLETVGSAKVSTAIKKFNSGSLQFNGSTDYLMIPGNPIFNLGTSDWTVEAWVYLNALPTSDAWPTNFSQHMVLIGEGTASQGDGFCCIIGQTKLLVQNNDTQFASSGTHGMAINTWYHLAFVRSSGTIIFYVNGASTGSVAFSASLGTGAYTFIGCETAQGAYLNGYIDDLRFSRVARYTGPYFPLPTTSAQETGPSETEPGTGGVTYVAGDGLSSATAGLSAAAIKAQTGTNADGAYWINLPTVGPTQIYCIMNSAVAGGGWMMAMKATRGTTFSYSSTHWNSVTTLNPTQNNRADGDAKFNTMNYFEANDIMALFPDITTNGGSLGTNAMNCWTWLENNYNGGTRITPINFFNTAGTFNTGNVNTPSNYGGKFIKDAKTFAGWTGQFSGQANIRFYGFNFKNPDGYGSFKCRWGFGWNENGEPLYETPASLVGISYAGSNDVGGGIGMDSSFGSYSAGDYISCCQDATGINRSARVEIYIK